jgi:nicotinamidase-related amidase
VAAQVELPTIPAPVAVTVERGSTALLVLDIVEPLCTIYAPACEGPRSAASDLLARARAADMFIVHARPTIPGAAPLPEVTPLANEPSVSGPSDKFLDTDLDEHLRGRGIRTVIVVGFASEGAVLYTSSGSAFRGYTVVLAEDGMGGISPFGTFYVKHQLLNLPGRFNPENEPLREGHVTLSRSDLITIQ